MGARMNIAGKGALGESWPLQVSDWGVLADEEEGERKGRSRSVSNDSRCRPKWFRCTRTSSPPRSSWPPRLADAALASAARRIKPAQVPQVGFFAVLVASSSQHKRNS